MRLAHRLAAGTAGCVGDAGEPFEPETTTTQDVEDGEWSGDGEEQEEVADDEGGAEGGEDHELMDAEGSEIPDEEVRSVRSARGEAVSEAQNGPGLRAMGGDLGRHARGSTVARQGAGKGSHVRAR